MKAFIVGMIGFVSGVIITIVSPFTITGVLVIGIAFIAGGIGVALMGMPDLVYGVPE
jgi:hypothetical protein